MLRTIRILLAVFFFTSITLLFLDYTGTLNNWLGWTAKLQLLPAILSLNLAVVAGIFILTLLFGRFYCSTVCPLGVFQDMVSRLNRKKRRFGWMVAANGVRYGILVVFIALLVFGLGTVANAIALLIAPYSAYGRIVSQLLLPIVQGGNNIVAALAAHTGGYVPGLVELRPVNVVMLAIASVTLLVVAIFAWRKGRLYCNTICPVGAVLSVLSRMSFYKLRIHEHECVHCGLCAKDCKSSCIDPENRTIDYSRCVVCGDCAKVCRGNAIHFERPGLVTIDISSAKEKGAEPETVAISKTSVKEVSKEGTKEESKAPGVVRRGFLTGLVFLLSSKLVHAQKPKEKEYIQRGDGGLAPLKPRRNPERETRIVPPGAVGLRDFARRCTGCQLCVSSCPSHVLRPSTKLDTFMQPEVSFEDGWCRPECVECSSVCPAGAIRPLTVADKSARQIGHSVWTKELCIVLTDDVQCDNCVRHCPAEAIQMVSLDPKNPKSKKIPAVDTERCIGCGACEYVCPARPVAAIHVEGHELHRTI